MRVQVTNKGLRRLRSGHPWVFANDLRNLGTRQAGLATLLSPTGDVLGQGLFNPKSKIALRMLSGRSQALGNDFFAERVTRAVQHRQTVAEGFEAFRVIHSEADGLPGLTVDKYGEYLVLQQHAAALEPFMPVILDTLQSCYQPKGILARNDSEVRSLEGLAQEVRVLSGQVPEMLGFKEGDVTLIAQPYSGQKTGAFLDQRSNHIIAGASSRGRCLDVFSYHGGFALQLAKHAESVLAVDSSAAALDHLQHTAQRLQLRNIQSHCGDAFALLRQLEQDQQRFDTIVLDPPAFAKGRDHVDGALRGYKEINLRAMRLLNPGGRLFTASCSYHVKAEAFETMLSEAAADAERSMRVLFRRSQALCHPEILTIPETRYLKFIGLELYDS